MVNANVIISVSAVAIATMVSIVVWMHMRGQTTSTMTLAEACDGYFGENGSAGAEGPSSEGALNSCDTIRANGWEWDTPIACSAESDSYYTMRGVFDAEDRNLVNIKNSGLQDGETGSFTETIDYITDSCSGAGRKLITELEAGRELWSIGELNYGPCSVALAVSFMKSLVPSWGIDVAECSGNPLSKGNCRGVVGTTTAKRAQIFAMYSRTSNNWIQQGCYNHDICLQKGGNGNSASPIGTYLCGAAARYSGAVYAGRSYGGMYGRDCDHFLGQAASHCNTDWSCSGFACSGSSWDCSDSTVAGIAIWAAIGVIRPNAGFCGV